MAGWIVVLAVSVVVYFMLTVFVAPRVFLVSGFSGMSHAGTGLKSYRTPGGRSSVFAPDAKTRKYIKQYVLSERNGRKIMVCKIEPSLSYLEFDVAVFDLSGEAITVLTVKEIIENRGYTSAIELPDETAYASLVLRRADGRVFPASGGNARVSRGRVALYMLSSGVLTVLEILCIKFCLSGMFGGLFGESFMVSPVVLLVTAIICAVAVAVNIACTAAYFAFMNSKSGARTEDKE